MDGDRKQRQFNWGSLIGWLIFILVLATGPLAGVIRRTFGSTVPWQALPAVIGALVLLSIAVSVVRALVQSRSRSDTRLPTGSTRPMLPPNAPMPPYGRGTPYRPPSTPSPRSFTLPSSREPSLPAPPRFEPLINPQLLAVGIVGLVILAGVGLFLLGAGLP